MIVVTQSVADIEALSGQPGLLPSLTDNFSGVVAHRRTAPESRDWLAKLMGTRALWQSTNQTSGHGTQHSGRGSARRVREFRIGSDTFAELGRGEAVIYTTLGPDPLRTSILPVELDERQPERIGAGPRHACELPVHPELSLPSVVDAAGEGPSSAKIDPGARTCDFVQIPQSARPPPPLALDRRRAGAIYLDELSNAALERTRQIMSDGSNAALQSARRRVPWHYMARADCEHSGGDRPPHQDRTHQPQEPPTEVQADHGAHTPTPRRGRHGTCAAGRRRAGRTPRRAP